MVRLMMMVILSALLIGCTTSVLTPTNQLVQKAIALQLEQTQNQLNQKLDINFQGFEINRLSITQKQPLNIQNLPAYRVRGTYNLTFKLPKRQVKQPQKPFDLYLQLQTEGKTWRLLLPETSSKDNKQVWHSYLIH